MCWVKSCQVERLEALCSPSEATSTNFLAMVWIMSTTTGKSSSRRFLHSSRFWKSSEVRPAWMTCASSTALVPRINLATSFKADVVFAASSMAFSSCVALAFCSSEAWPWACILRRSPLAEVALCIRRSNSFARIRDRHKESGVISVRACNAFWQDVSCPSKRCNALASAADAFAALSPFSSLPLPRALRGGGGGGLSSCSRAAWASSFWRFGHWDGTPSGCFFLLP